MNNQDFDFGVTWNLNTTISRMWKAFNLKYKLNQ